MSDLRDHLLDLLTDATHEPRCRSKVTCFCLVGRLRWLLDVPDPFRKEGRDGRVPSATAADSR